MAELEPDAALTRFFFFFIYPSTRPLWSLLPLHFLLLYCPINWSLYYPSSHSLSPDIGFCAAGQRAERVSGVELKFPGPPTLLTACPEDLKREKNGQPSTCLLRNTWYGGNQRANASDPAGIGRSGAGRKRK